MGSLLRSAFPFQVFQIICKCQIYVLEIFLEGHIKSADFKEADIWEIVCSSYCNYSYTPIVPIVPVHIVVKQSVQLQNTARMSNSSSIFALTSESWHFFIPIVWTVSALTLSGSAIAISYLNSKPPLSRTIMDCVNLVCFAHIVIYGLVTPVHLSLVIVFKDCGEVLSGKVTNTFLVILYFQHKYPGSALWSINWS